MGQTQFKDFTLENEKDNFTILENQINKLKSQGKLTPQVQLKPLQNHRTSVVNFTGQDKQALKLLLDSNLPEIKINSQLQFSLIKQQSQNLQQLSNLMNQYETKISQYIKKKVQQGSKKQQQNTFPSTQITVQQAVNQQGVPTPQQTVTVSTGGQSVAVTTPQQSVAVQGQPKKQQESSMFSDLFGQAPQQTVTVSTGGQSVAVTIPQQNITVEGQAQKQKQQTQASDLFSNLFGQQVKKQQKGSQASDMFGNLLAPAPQQTVTVQGQTKKQPVSQLSKQQSIAKLYDLLNKITSDSYRHGRTLEQLKRDFQYYQSFLTDKQKDRFSLMDASDQSIIDSMQSIIQRQIKASQKISDKEELLKSLKQTIQMAKSKGYDQEYSQDDTLLEKLEKTFIPEIQKYIQQTRRISQKNIDTNLNYLDQMVQRLGKHKKVQVLAQPVATPVSMYNQKFGKQIFIPLDAQRQQADMTKRQTMRNQRRATQKSNLQKLSKQELQHLLTMIPGQNSKKSQELGWKDFGDLKNRRKMINAVLKK